MTLDSSEFLEVLGVFETAHNAAEETLVDSIAADEDGFLLRDTTEVLRRAELLEHEAHRLYASIAASPSDTSIYKAFRRVYSACFDCWLTVEMHSLQDSDLIIPPLGQNMSAALRLAVAGLAAGRIAETRVQLRRLLPSAPVENAGFGDIARSNWHTLVATSIAQATIWLIRKADDWADIDAAVRLLQSLRQWQTEHEEAYLGSNGNNVELAVTLVGLYHLAQALTSCSNFLIEGEGAYDGVIARIDRHHDQAVVAAEQSNNGYLRHFADIIWVACRELTRNSIWAQAAGLGDEVKKLASALTSRARRLPVLELWPSQQEALSSNMLDSYRRAILVEMPTSAGKTLLAKFAIMQTKNLHREGVIAYLVPTRALVNQVTVDLRNDLGPLGLAIEPTVSAFELDPSEDILLAQAPDVLVSTPEKFSLLLRRNHPCTQDLSMVVADEAHNLSDGERGARLELVLSTIRRDRPNVRFLMLSPFVPEAQDLVEWLGGDRYLPPISVNWKAARRVVGAIEVSGRARNRELRFESLDAAGNSDLSPGKIISLGQTSDPAGTIKSVSRLAAIRLRDRGSSLVLCWGPSDAMERAQEIARNSQEISSPPLHAAVSEYVDGELGEGSSLAYCLRRGVAYHHSGLSHETRWLIESLVKRNIVHTVCGTTTLAQGVNFPISNVLIEDRRKGRDGKLSYSDLWNIAGRAGRTLLDDVGLVGFPVGKGAQKQDWQEFLRGEAVAISSQLAEIITRADEIGNTFNVNMVAEVPALGDLLQFLAHAMRVGGYRDTADNVEDLLRSSLVYHQSRARDREGTAKLVRLCRSYLEQVSGRPGVVALSDQTGFSTPSIFKLMALQRRDPSFRAEEDWLPSRLFDRRDDEPLALRIGAVADIPEINLGTEYTGSFDAHRVAQIVQGWVSGDSIMELAERFGAGDVEQPEKRLANFASYLNGKVIGQVSWGLGALATVCLGGEERPTDKAVPESSRYVPAMVYFGVNTPEAIWLRMAGAPRLAAFGLAEMWRNSRVGSPQSMQQVRQWIRELNESDWRRAVSTESVSGRSLHLIWQECFT